MKKEFLEKEIIGLDDCFSLEGKNVVVFGGAGKMAASFSRTLLAARCRNLALVDSNAEKVQDVAAKLKKEFPDRVVFALAGRADNDVALERIVRALKKKAGTIDVLIYAVMSKPENYYAPLPVYRRKTWDESLSGNLSGAFLVTQKCIPLFNTKASVIYISSTYGIVSPDFRIYEKVKSNIYGGKYPLTLPAVYAASKAGLIGLARYMAVYLADKEIRVNAFVPGGVYDSQDENFYREYVKRTPLRRMAAWTDYNGAILFLASEASRYMTGQILVVDGGFSAW
jgi:NAD(P)-dependent dehydrogenase (short-subunit alcohol dehydrogenase family)